MIIWLWLIDEAHWSGKWYRIHHSSLLFLAVGLRHLFGRTPFLPGILSSVQCSWWGWGGGVAVPGPGLDPSQLSTHRSALALHPAFSWRLFWWPSTPHPQKPHGTPLPEEKLLVALLSPGRSFKPCPAALNTCSIPMGLGFHRGSAACQDARWQAGPSVANPAIVSSSGAPGNPTGRDAQSESALSAPDGKWHQALKETAL